MARPKKEGVDWFPHQCISGKTLTIIEGKYGNDGYAFWFKLLELLGSKPSHYINLSDETEMEFLQAKTHLDGVMVCRILDLLCRLNAIDQKLWEKRIIWCQNLVNNLSPVYTNRRVEIPKKPDISQLGCSFYRPKPHEDDVSTEFSGVSTPESTQSRVEESRVEKSIILQPVLKNTCCCCYTEKDELKKAAAAEIRLKKDLPEYQVLQIAEDVADKYTGKEIKNWDYLISRFIKNHKPRPEVETNGNHKIDVTVKGIQFNKAKTEVKLSTGVWQKLGKKQQELAKNGALKPEEIFQGKVN